MVRLVKINIKTAVFEKTDGVWSIQKTNQMGGNSMTLIPILHRFFFSFMAEDGLVETASVVYLKIFNPHSNQEFQLHQSSIALLMKLKVLNLLSKHRLLMLHEHSSLFVVKRQHGILIPIGLWQLVDQPERVQACGLRFMMRWQTQRVMIRLLVNQLG